MLKNIKATDGLPSRKVLKLVTEFFCVPPVTSLQWAQLKEGFFLGGWGIQGSPSWPERWERAKEVAHEAGQGQQESCLLALTGQGITRPNGFSLPSAWHRQERGGSPEPQRGWLAGCAQPLGHSRAGDRPLGPARMLPLCLLTRCN